MSNDQRVFCQDCGEPLRMWSEPQFPYDRWLETPCGSCGTKPTESRYQDSDIFLAPPLSAPIGAVALTFEQLATSLRMAITMVCFDGVEGKGDVADALLSPLSYSEQVRVFSAVFLGRFPERENDVKRFCRKLERAGEGRNRVLHSWWLPGSPFFESGMRVNARISSGKLRKDAEEVSVKELTHLAAFMNRVNSDLLEFVLTALGRLPVPEPPVASTE